MSSTDGPYTASTGSMNGTYALVPPIPAGQTFKIVGVPSSFENIKP